MNNHSVLHPARALLHARRISLLLDVDGTLLEFASHPDHVSVSTPLLAVLEELHRRLQGRVALVSGRGIDSLNRLFLPFAPIAVGLHGLELRVSEYTGGERRDLVRRIDAEPMPVALRSRIEKIATAYPGSFLEYKGVTIAVHHRLERSDSERLAGELTAACAQLAPGWCVLGGRLVLEVKPAGISKATAVDHLMLLPEFADSAPIAFGDDLTDLDMFDAVRRHGGLAISVGPRIERAGDIHLDGPGDSYRLLRGLAEALRYGRPAASVFAVPQPAQLHAHATG